MKAKYISFHHNYSLPVREEMHEGAKHLIVPVVMMTEGVHNGSGGPMMYTVEEFGQESHLWNGMPVPVLHPTISGDPISCNSPEIIEQYNVGRIYNARIDQGKLKAEAWINIEKANQVSPELIAMIKAGQSIDISTGLYSNDEMIAGNWNGEEYQGTVRDIRPDHLALLPGQEGACNWEDGCGIRLNQLEGGDIVSQEMKEKVKSIDDAKTIGEEIAANVANPDKVSWVKRRLASLARFFSLQITDNSVSDEGIRSHLQSKIDELDQPPSQIQPQSGVYHYVVAVYNEEKYFIYESRKDGEGRKLLRQDFEIKDDVAIPKGTPIEVREQREFVAASAITKKKEAKQNIINNKEEKVMGEREKKVDELIANEASIYAEDTRDFLIKLDDDSFQKIILINEKVMANFQKVEDELKANKEKINNKGKEAQKKESDAPKTAEDFIANAPGEIGSMLQEGLSMRNQKKADLISTLTSNEKCPFTDEQLKSKDIPELESLVSLAGMNKVFVDYSGRGGNVSNLNAAKANEKKEDGTGVPEVPDLTANIQEKFKK